MAIWTPEAVWIGPCPNMTPNGMGAVYGVTLHTQDGNQQGSIAWFRNPKSKVSSHFLAPKVGPPVQIVDTKDKAWCQSEGNAHWLSIENEGHSGDQLTDDQLESCARILARAHREHGVPLQATDNPNGRGLGWHGMGGAAWGGHYQCPGAPIVAQRGDIIARANEIINGGANPAPGEGLSMAELNDINYKLDRLLDAVGFPGREKVTFHQNGPLFDIACLLRDGRLPYQGAGDPAANDPKSYIDSRLQRILDEIGTATATLSADQFASLVTAVTGALTAQNAALVAEVSALRAEHERLRQIIAAAGQVAS